MHSVWTCGRFNYCPACPQEEVHQKYIETDMAKLDCAFLLLLALCDIACTEHDTDYDLQRRAHSIYDRVHGAELFFIWIS